MYPLLLFIQGVQGIPLLQNITIPLPNGTSNHGTPGILCTPTRWTDILIFYLANYAAHAATTRSLPGEDASSFAIIVMAALLFPAAGAFRGILGIRSLSMFGKTDLEKAARAGALCMVVRTHKWRPNASDSLHNTIICLPSGVTKGENENSEEGLPTATQENRTQSNNMAPKNTRLMMYDPPKNGFDLGKGLNESRIHIHGHYNLPAGYSIYPVPRWAKFMESNRDPRTTQTARLSYNYNLVKIMVSLGQAIYAIFTLYRARGDQIAQFGYAAFGLTVAPYAVVSVLNLLGSLLCPEFPALYMVESSIMEEARRRGGEYVFEGTVGRLNEDMVQWSLNNTPIDWSWLWFVLCSFLAALIQVVINGALSRFHKGHSTHAQRVWTMTWLGFGGLCPIWAVYMGLTRSENDMKPKLALIYHILFYSAPAIGGFVVVGQMLRSYGTCVSFLDSRSSSLWQRGTSFGDQTKLEH